MEPPLRSGFVGRLLATLEKRIPINQVFSPVAGTLLVGGSALNGAVQVVGAFGGLGSLTFTGLFFGLVWQLLVGAIQFARIIFARPDGTRGA
jgi:hypothetical protein